MLIAHRFHSPQPGASSHLGLETMGAIQSPSSSSSHSSGFSASANDEFVEFLPNDTTELQLTRVGDRVRLIVKPSLRLLSLFIGDLVGRVLIPVLRLSRLGVGDALLVNPVLRFLVLRVINLSVGID